MKDLGDWLFLIGMGGLAGGYYIYENKTDVAAWVDTVQAATEPTRITDHWGMILLVIVLVIVGIMLIGDSLNKRSAVKETTTAAAIVKRSVKHKSVIGKGKGEFIE